MKTHVAIIGGGPGGSTLAMFLLQEGITPVIIEKETFPRYHVGESMTGECGNVVRALGLEDKMLEGDHPIKRGVTVYGPEANNRWFVPVAGRDDDGELVDAFTWQVRRSEFDQMLLDEAQRRGAVLVRGQAVDPLLDDDGAVRGARVRMDDGGMQGVVSEVLVDASGQSAFLSNSGVAGKKVLGRYDKQIAIFSQVPNAVRDEGKHRDDTLIFYQEKFHWAWFIPIDDEIVSVGVVIPAEHFVSKQESKRDFLVRELHELNPELKRRIPEVQLVEEVRAIPNYSYHVPNFTGRGYLCIGDAHRFIDPIFSFGLFVTTKEAQLAAPAIRAYLEGAHRDAPDPFADHARRCEEGLDVVQDLIDVFWEHPRAFAFAVHHHRYRGDFIDMLAGRIHDLTAPPRGLEAMRTVLDQER